MDFGLKESVYTGQSLRLSPQMLESLEILQFSAVELYDFLEKIALENPVIDMDVLEAGEKKRRTKSVLAGEPAPDISEYVEDRLSDLPAQLKLQLDASLTRDAYLVACYLIDNLNDDGYLSEPLEETAARLEISKELAETALRAVQRLEPKGIGAADLRECLLLQLEAKGFRDTVAWRLANGHLPDIAQNKLPRIAKNLGLTQAVIADAIELLRRECDPRPLASERTEEIVYALPDIDVRLNAEGGLTVLVIQLEESDLAAEPGYVELAGKNAALDDKTREFLGNNFNQLKLLKRSLSQRNATMKRCAEELVRLQAAFFKYGPQALKPLLRQELARALNVSESTVSRAFNGKYISCDWGVFPAGYFFPMPVSQGEGNIIKPEVCGAISEIIASEDSRKPLSDSAIEKMLREMGICISRRTVALYRDEMGIPASSIRKKHI